jgi:hypothetical protein
MQPTVVELRNTIVSSDGSSPNFLTTNGGQIVSRGHNISSDNSGDLTADGDMPNTDPMLGALADNGGPTLTRALLPGSPAIDAGDNAGAANFDQRGPGFARVVNGTIDIGAYEVQDTGARPAPARAAVQAGLLGPASQLRIAQQQEGMVSDKDETPSPLTGAIVTAREVADAVFVKTGSRWSHVPAGWADEASVDSPF